MIDDPLEKLLEDLDSAKRHLETRVPLIREALEELPHAKTVTLEEYLGYGRSLRLDDNVREALREAAEGEIEDLKAGVEEIREKIMARRMALAGLPT